MCILLSCMKVKVSVVQLCPILRYPMNCSPPDSSVHGILQARILGWFVISFSRWSSWPWRPFQTRVSCIAGEFLPSEPSSWAYLIFLNNIKPSLNHPFCVNVFPLVLFSYPSLLFTTQPWGSTPVLQIFGRGSQVVTSADLSRVRVVSSPWCVCCSPSQGS